MKHYVYSWQDGILDTQSGDSVANKKNYTTHLQVLLDRWSAGDESAVGDIIVHSQDRLRLMASRMLKAKPHVGRWNQTDDVLQNALIRLHRSLRDVKPDSKRAFNGLAATQIRRELIDMARSLYGPEGLGRNHKSDLNAADPDGNMPPLHEGMDQATDVADQLEMMEFHESVGKLHHEEKEVFELIFYQGMTQAEVGKLLGVSERTIKRRWRQARLSLRHALGTNE
ncbi:RNA polymerase sigma factor [Calycomorphotria hydatis]|uniref:RNA polymerase sigma factor CnrH n=1 Tax=Calycomorphotria hydatis TaxID=2528027 RepID=A0A517T8R0_9PLAN|nr:sigma-70 family RNA polymerase sigma factor [Calycomorphotria hydatis]QDT64772.1 RNA polymerase sigma factor CnrH [Calycomorphotria hydatis]